MMYWGKHEDMTDPDFLQFLKEYEAWRPKNPGFLTGYDWRHSYVAMKVLGDVRGYDMHKQYAWLKKTCLRAFRKHPKEYFLRFAEDATILLGSYDFSFQLVRNTESVKVQYPWVMDLTKNYNAVLCTYMNGDVVESDKSERWRKLQQGMFFRIYDEQENSLAQRALLKMNDWYLASLKREYRVVLLVLLLAGALIGFLLFNFLDHVLALGVCAYHVLIPLLILAPVVRYRYPVNGLLIIMIVAGVWLLLAPLWRLHKTAASLRLKGES